MSDQCYIPAHRESTMKQGLFAIAISAAAVGVGARGEEEDDLAGRGGAGLGQADAPPVADHQGRAHLPLQLGEPVKGASQSSLPVAGSMRAPSAGVTDQVASAATGTKHRFLLQAVVVHDLAVQQRDHLLAELGELGGYSADRRIDGTRKQRELLDQRGTVFLLGGEDGQTAPLVAALTGHIAREARRLADARDVDACVPAPSTFAFRP